jgi:hypothetical protein
MGPAAAPAGYHSTDVEEKIKIKIKSRNDKRNVKFIPECARHFRRTNFKLQ